MYAFGRDVDGVEIPAGAVSRSQSEDFLGDSSLPSWLSKVGGSSTTLTHNDISASKGMLKVEMSNVNGGLVGPQIDISQFAEIRVGAVFATDLTYGNAFRLNLLADNTKIEGQNNAINIAWWENDLALTTKVGGGINTNITPAGPDFTYNGGPSQAIALELRVRPGDETVALCNGEGEPFSVTENAAFDETLTYYPGIGLNTTYNGNTESIWIAQMYYEVIHS